MEGFASEQLRMLPRLCRPSRESMRNVSEALVLSEVCSAGLDVIPSMLPFFHSLLDALPSPSPPSHQLIVEQN